MGSQLLVKQPEKIVVCDGSPSTTPTVKATYPGSQMSMDPRGTLIAIATANNVIVLQASTLEKVCDLPVAGASRVLLSPAGRFVVTLQRVNKESNDKNLKIWRASDGGLVLELHHRPKSADSPLLEFTSDDGLAGYMITNTVHLYDTGNSQAGPSKKLHAKGLVNFAVSPQPGAPHIAVFVPEAKGSPAHVALYPTAPLRADKAETPMVVARKAFFRASAVRFMWNSTGAAVLALAMSDVDVTNQSYYGEQKLHYLAADGTDATLNLPKDGPIYDVQWAPDGDTFLVVAGYMPAKPVLYNSKCKALFEFAAGPYNMVRWNPFSRFLALAGFGNLPGDVAFFSKAKDGKCTHIGNVRAENGVSLEWDPSGRHVVVATTTPRLRVDNCMRFYKYDGTLLAKVPYDVLLDAAYVPAAPSTFADRPQSPGARKPVDAGGAAAGPSGEAAPSSYIPPYLRGRANAAALAKGSFSLARDPNDAGARVPGSSNAPVSKSAAKNAKRRAKKAAESSGGGVAENGGEAEESTTAANAATEAPGDGAKPSTAPSADGQQDIQKKIRALTKKLQQIELLKDKQSKGQQLDPDQVKKIATETQVKQEVADLQQKAAAYQ